MLWTIVPWQQDKNVIFIPFEYSLNFRCKIPLVSWPNHLMISVKTLMIYRNLFSVGTHLQIGLEHFSLLNGQLLWNFQFLQFPSISGYNSLVFLIFPHSISASPKIKTQLVKSLSDSRFWRSLQAEALQLDISFQGLLIAANQLPGQAPSGTFKESLRQACVEEAANAVDMVTQSINILAWELQETQSCITKRFSLTEFLESTGMLTLGV